MYRLLLLLPCAAAFMGGQPHIEPRLSSTRLMGGAKGGATTLEGKTKRIEQVKGLLDTSQMIFTVPGGSMTVSQTQKLRQSMPGGTTIVTVKNTLMQRALADTEYESAGSLLKGPNTWFFIEEDMGASIKAFKAFAKEEGKLESHPILGGVMESVLYDSAGVDAVGKLPSKDELYAMIAGAIKAVPTKVGRVVKAPNSKLARAIKLAGEKAES